MRIAQTECGKLVIPEKAESSITTQKQQQLSIPTAPILATALIFTSTSATASTTIKREIKSKDENVCSKDAAASTKASGKMTDEHSSESNDIKTKCDSNSRGSSGKNENKSGNESINAGDADILLKNDLNGNTAAIVATSKTNSLLSVTSSFQLSSHSQLPENLVLAQSGFSVQVSRSSSQKLLEPKKLSASTLGSTIGCQQQDKFQNNGFSVYFSSTLSTEKTAEFFSSNTNKMAAATANPPLAHLNAGINTISDVCLKSDNGVIDYTTHNSLSHGSVSNNISNNNKKIAVQTLTTNNSNNTNSNSGDIDNSNINNGVDIGRSAIFSASGCINMNASVNCGGGYGGRLQFFKEGKIILELQRSKDGDKNGWVSVSRKPFRPPAATSSTVTPTSAACSGYSKNESSTSLSFSDDNSSVQSSPWQRDHCWKQLTPRCGISKEMSLLYRRPKGVELTQRAFHLALKKRRRPYDTLLDGNVKSIFEKINNLINLNSNNLRYETDKSTLSGQSNINVEITINDINDGKADLDARSSLSLSSTTILANVNRAKSDIKIEKNLPGYFLNGLGEKKNGESIVSNTHVRNISGDDEIRIINGEKGKEKKANLFLVNRNVEDKMALADIKNETVAQLEKTVDNMYKTASKVDELERTEDKRLKMKTKKVRAKLSIIIQKLINSAPSHTIQSSLKTFSLPPPSGTVGNSHANNTALSPISSSAMATATVVVTATTTTSRLFEYHQQHVSPRKRILRQLEKVSLEDTAGIIGVKRSRAKNTTHSQIHNRQSHITGNSSHTRTHPITSVTTQNLPSTNSSVNHQQKTKPITSSSPPISVAAPPRLYSSYSIHSLLSGSNGSSSSLSISSTASKKTTKANDTAIISSDLGYQHPQIYADSSYLHAVLATPKSPENPSSSSACGGKSPSTSTSSKKRSPPYSSTMQDANIEYGRCSPRVSTSLEINSGTSTRTNKYNMRFSAVQSVPSSTNSQNLYSSYMTSPKFTTPSTSHPNHTTTSNILANAPGHISESAKYIPQTNVSLVVPRELSPARLVTSSPRDFTRRTVPKKTVSIRRQFASPITANVNSSSLSPKDRESDRERVRDRYQEWNRSNMSLEDISAPHATTFRQRGSSVTVGSVPISSSLPYYIYPPDNDSLSPHASVTAPPPSVVNPSVAAAVAAASAYIPPVVSSSYFPYISTLAALRHNPMWLHYPGSMTGILPTNHPTTSVPTSRLSPPFHTFPSYNGIAIAHHNMLTSVSTTMHNHHSAGILDCAQLPKLTDSGADHSTTTSKNIIPTSTFEGAASSTLFSSSSIVKEELSSDIPLNLSKR